MDDSTRTYDSSVSDDSLPSSPIEDSLDECVHVPQHANQDVLDLIQKRLSHHEDSDNSHTRAGARHSVSFIDEELGLTPRHIVTQIHYRPRTTDEEKDKLYYNRQAFDTFEQEDLYEKIENEIQEIEKQKKLIRKGEKLVVKVEDEMKLKHLMLRLERQSNFSSR